ncbi:hypothetical protein CMV_016072 [Castanea mollissima]|uniref:(+)-neomenthol dehydrogenase n=1 Tax=Castanea mollissima TaxID=60419 RepID=A0A8J4R0C5_9ROSI|nr:hypothetical protein CMV_016072 [Castanea mollissima]
MRIKAHLAGYRGHDIQICEKVTANVRDGARQAIEGIDKQVIKASTSKTGTIELKIQNSSRERERERDHVPLSFLSPIFLSHPLLLNYRSRATSFSLSLILPNGWSTTPLDSLFKEVASTNCLPCFGEIVYKVSSPNWIAVVTGANKGIGYGICQQLASNGVKVVLTARDVKRGNEAVDKLKTAGYSDVVFHQLDVTDPVSISSLVDFSKTQFGKLDILVNNAGINGAIVDKELWNLGLDEFLGPNAKPLKELIKQTYQTSENCLRTNYYGTKQVSKELIPLLQSSNSARIVNVSSGVGQLKFISNENARKKLEDVDGLTEEKVDEVVEGPECLHEGSSEEASQYCYYSVGPGYTKTDLNDNTGVVTIAEAAKGPVMLALMPEGGPSGLYFDQTEVSNF